MSSPAAPRARAPLPSFTTRSVLRRSWLAVFVGIVVGVLGGVAAVVVLPKSYTADTSVLVTSTGVDTAAASANGRTNSTINMDTEAQLVTSAAVVQAAAEADPALSKKSFQALVGSIAITVPANTTVLVIAYTDSTAGAAQAGANALASAYLTDRQTTAQGNLDGQIASARDSVSSLTEQLQTLTDKLSSSNGPQKNLINSKLTLIKSQINAENSHLVTLNNIQITPGRVVTAASRPTGPASPSKAITLASGLGVGLVLGVLVAWLLVRYRRRVVAAEDLVRLTESPCLSVIAAQHLADPGKGPGAAQLRRLALVTLATVDEPAVVVITSPTASPTGSSLATGLAVSLANSGTPTTVLQVHDLDVERSAAVSTTRVRHADDLVSDSDESMPQALQRLRGPHAVLVVDVPSDLLDADAQTLAAHADAVLVVVDKGTRAKIVHETVVEFDSVGAPLLGTVLIGRGGRSARSRRAAGRSAARSDADGTPTANGSAATKNTAAGNNGKAAKSTGGRDATLRSRT